MLAGLAEVLRNLGVVFIGGPVIEPFINPGKPFGTVLTVAAVLFGLAMIVGSLMIDALRTDDP
jgi:hypothetical protein